MTSVELGRSEVAWARAEVQRELEAEIPLYGLWAKHFPPVKEEWVREREAKLLVPEEKLLERIMRYEAHLHRQLLQSMHELEALQARRRGEMAPLARLDVAGGPVMGSWRRERKEDSLF
jgi:hypothetical protein